MALPITTASDYKGKVRISTSKGTQFGEYITEYERKYLRLILGDECYNDIKDYVNPLPQKYIDLFNGVNYTNENGDFVAYEGFKESLIRFVYAEYNADSFQTSIGGNVKSVNENSTLLGAGNTIVIAQRYNEAVIDYYDEVYPFLKEYEDMSLTATGSSEVATLYTITVDSTKYLNEGSIVTVDRTDYTISNVVTDTSFDLTDTTGKDFTGEKIDYTPFYDVCLKDFNLNSMV